jgi:hypothetical protein
MRIGTIKGMSHGDWAHFFGQIYHDVFTHNPGRVEMFNGDYGLNGGLGAALICLAVAVEVVEASRWRLAVDCSLLVASISTACSARACTSARSFITAFWASPPNQRPDKRSERLGFRGRDGTPPTSSCSTPSASSMRTARDQRLLPPLPALLPACPCDDDS